MNTKFHLLTFVTSMIFGVTAAWAGTQTKIEAESGTPTQATIQGTAVNLQEGSLDLSFSLDESKLYDIYIAAHSSGQHKENLFYLNGSSVNFITEANNFELTKIASSVKIRKGENSIQIKSVWGWITIDYIMFEEVEAGSSNSLETKLCTPNPTPEAVALYDFLLDNYGEKIISGAMTLNDSDETNWLKAQTGKEPALMGIDFIFANMNYSWYKDETPRNIALEWYNRNGIPAFCWHWHDPSRQTEGFYAKKGEHMSDGTSFDISCVNDPESEGFKAIISDLDFIAEQFLWLQEQKVAVIWRPLHEAAGGWFWWGAGSAKDCKTLYHLMFDRLVNHHGVRNLIWVWTYQAGESSDWYPGDEYVDIIGRDIYKDGDHSSQILEFGITDEAFSNKKMITLSECGSFPDPDELIADKSSWSWFMPWYGDYVEKDFYNSLDLWKKTMQSEYVITLDEMPDLRTYSSAAANDASLKSLQLTPGKLNKDFAPDIFDYDIEFAENLPTPTVKAVAKNSKAVVKITEDKQNNKIIIVVTSADGTKQQTYTIRLVTYKPTPSKIELTPTESTIGIYESTTFQAKIFDQKGLATEGSVNWKVSGGGSIKNGLFTSNGTAGTFTVTATIGETSAKVKVNVVNGATFDVPNAQNWTSYNLWYGSSQMTRGNSDDALYFTNIQWGYGEIWAINIGDDIKLEKGKEYVIQFDFRNTKSSNAVSLLSGFEKSYIERSSIDYASTTEEIEIAPTEEFLPYQITVTALEDNPKAHLFFMMSWGKDPVNQKPKEEVSLYFKNIKILPKVTEQPTSPTQTITLSEGWNLVSINVLPTNTAVEELFPTATIVKTDADYFESTQDTKFNIKEIEAGKGYLIYSTQNTQVEIEGSEYVATETQLTQGWNLIAYPLTEDKAISDIFTSDELNNIEVIKDLTNTYEPQKSKNNLSVLKQGKAYYVKAKTALNVKW